MLISIIAVVAIFFLARFVASLGIERPAYYNMAGAGAVLFFALGMWADHALFANSPPAPAPPVAAIAPVPAAPPAPVNVTSPLGSAPMTPSPNAISRAAIARLSPAKGAPFLGAIDAITTTRSGAGSPSGSTFPAGSTIFVFGWAATSAKKPVDGLVISIDGRPHFEGTASYGGQRVDVAKAFGAPQMAATGFSAVGISTAGLAKGEHAMQVGGLSSDHRHFSLAEMIVHFRLQ